jgi:hypothetical protein
VRHGATGIVQGDLSEFFFRLFIPERVQQGDTALERLLHPGRAGTGTGDRTEFRRSQILVVMMTLIVIGNGRNGRDQCKKKKKQPPEPFHKKTSLKREFSRVTSRGSNAGAWRLTLK